MLEPLPQIEIKCDEDQMFATSIKARAVYARGTIGCGKCGHAIHVYKVAGLADEFSLRAGPRRFDS